MAKEPFKEGEFANRTRREKIIILIAGILFILCIVFIALFAKELSRNNDSSSASSRGHPGQCLLYYAVAIRTGTVRRVWFAIRTVVGIFLAIVGGILVIFDF